MVKIKVNPDLTEEDVPALVAELEKLSSLNPVKDILKAAGKSIEPLPAEKMIGARPRENDVYLKDYVDGALELAQMLGIEDQGTISPSKGLSFRAKNYKFYDFMGYWSALIKRFSKNEERITVLEQDSEDVIRCLADAEQNDKEQASTLRWLSQYALDSRQRSDKKIEAVQADGADFKEAAILFAEHMGDFAIKAEKLTTANSVLSVGLYESKKQHKKLKKQFFWYAVFSAIPTFYLYYIILSKIF
jgi:hypothetical protein